jgi:hypothetical protein
MATRQCEEEEEEEEDLLNSYSTIRCIVVSLYSIVEYVFNDTIERDNNATFTVILTRTGIVCSPQVCLAMIVVVVDLFCT